MKLNFLDKRNCRELLPRGKGLPWMARLEECLDGINNLSDALRGSIDALIRQNKKTKNQKIGSRRLCSSPIMVVQVYSLVDRVVDTQPVGKRFPGPALFHTIIGYENGIEHKTIVPLQFLLKGWGDASFGFQCYCHTIAENVGNIQNFDELWARQQSDSGSYHYIGITGRNWLLRLDEHFREVRRGTRRSFYRAWRERYGMADVVFGSSLGDINLSYRDAMNWEERQVDKIASDQLLNMIPGGFKGLRLLHKLRITDRVNIPLKDRDKAIQEYVRRNPRKGVPNPFMADLWKDDEFYLKVIKARQKTLSPDQVRKIRELAQLGQTDTEIVKEVGAIDERQVRDVISGKYYGRIK